MKQFKDLEFQTHPTQDGFRAFLEFDNGYGVSVVRFKIGNNELIKMFAENGEYGSYTRNENEWEVAVTKNGSICYNTELTDDVLKYQTASDVDEIMRRVQELEEV